VSTRSIVIWLASVAGAFALGFYWAGFEPGLASRDEARAAFGEALDERDSVARFARLGQLLGALDAENLQGAVEALEARSLYLGEPEIRMMAYGWAQVDGPGAFERVNRQWPQRIARRHALSEVAYAWALRDPTAAAQAVEQGLPPTGDPTVREMVLRKLIEAWASTPDFRTATEFVASMPRSGQRQGLTTVIAQQRLRAGGPEDLIAWAESVHEDAPGKYRLVAFRKAGRMLAQQDPERAAAWLSEHYGKEYTNGMTRLVAIKWVEDDPEAGMAWLLRRPDDEERKYAVGFAYRDWLRREPEAAGDWLRAAAPGPVLDPAIDPFARRLARESPAEAIEWAERITDPERRVEVLEAVGQAWFTRDPAATRAWLAGVDLPEETAHAILNPPVRKRRARPPALQGAGDWDLFDGAASQRGSSLAPAAGDRHGTTPGERGAQGSS